MKTRLRILQETSCGRGVIRNFMDIYVTLIAIWKLLTHKSRKFQPHLNFTAEKQDSEKKQPPRSSFLNASTPTHTPREVGKIGRKE